MGLCLGVVFLDWGLVDLLYWLVRLVVLGCFYSRDMLGLHRHSHPLNCVGLFLWGVLWNDLLCLRLLSLGEIVGLEGHL